MARLFATLLLALVTALPAQAVHSDPLNSAACKAARVELDAALKDEADSRLARDRRLALARSQMAKACLGPASATPERSGAPQPAQTVPPPVISGSPKASAPAPEVVPLPALVIPRPSAITSCDPAGCWDSEGRRLNQMGPSLIGPQGLCSAQGGMVNCP